MFLIVSFVAIAVRTRSSDDQALARWCLKYGALKKKKWGYLMGDSAMHVQGHGAIPLKPAGGASWTRASGRPHLLGPYGPQLVPGPFFEPMGLRKGLGTN